MGPPSGVPGEASPLLEPRALASPGLRVACTGQRGSTNHTDLRNVTQSCIICLSMKRKRCTICGASLEQGQRRYCSAACAGAGHDANRRVKRPHPRKCGACGSRFRPTRHGQRYCCGACRQSEYRVRFRRYIATLAAGDPLVHLGEDMRAMFKKDFLGMSVDPRRRRQLDHDRAVIEEDHANDELERAGIDPRPARKDGRALK